MPDFSRGAVAIADHEAAESLQRLSKQLDPLIRGLADAGRMTERVFLDLGEQVRSSHTRALQMTQGSQDTLDALRSEEQQNTLPRLQTLVERCSQWLDDNSTRSSRICSALGEIDHQLLQLEEPLLGLRKIIKTLHSLRITTRIESSKSEGPGARVLADALHQLGTLIQAKVEEICTLIERLGALNSRALAAEYQDRDGLLSQARTEIAEAQQGLTHLSGSRSETTEHNAQLKTLSEQIGRSFGEMVAALQFQDITRQRLEHVQSNLSDLQRRLVNLDADERQVRHREVLGCICLLQHEQLKAAVQEFADASDSLRLNLRQMADSAVSLADNAQAFSATTRSRSFNQFTRIQRVLESISGQLNTAHSSHDSTRVALTEVCQAIEGVTSLVDDIEYIGEEMQLLAINAAVSAAHAHRHGSGLDVIARNIHSLSLEATGQAEILARDCSLVSSHALQLNQLEKDDQNNAGEVDRLLQESAQLMDSLGGHSQALDTASHQLLDQAGNLSAEVLEVARGMDIKERFTRQVAPVLDQLKQFGTWAGTSTARRSLSLDELLQQLQGRYTMSSERKVHHLVMAGQAAKPTAAAKPTPAAEPESLGRDHDLGDNIVLF